jgi:DNA helicase-2/ATP-dependent DNA helicase PcrA
MMGEDAKLVFLRQRREKLKLDYFSPVSNPEGQLADIAKYFSLLKQHVITPEFYKKFAQNLSTNDDAEHIEKTKHLELSSAFQIYTQMCQEENVIDYDDQIYIVLNMLKKRPNVRKVLQQRYHTILVDEFQDTNPMQSELIDLLVNTHQNLIVVGDDDQSIYGFRGASLNNILEFKDRYPKTSEVTLTENYRSDQNILDASYNLIQNNNPDRLEARLKIDKRLHGQFKDNRPEVLAFSILNKELNWLSESVDQLIKNGVNPGQIAILCRRNFTSGIISQNFGQAGIEHVVIGQKYELYKTEIVRLLVETLRAISGPAASTSLYHTLCGPFFLIPADELAVHTTKAKREYSELEEYLLKNEGLPDKLSAALKTLHAWRDQAPSISVGRLVYKIIEESGYKDHLYKEALSSSDAALSLTQLAQFFRKLKEFESIAVQPTALQFLESFDVLQAAGESSEDGTMELASDKVNILTIHKSKGLEWQYVFIPDCTEGSFPMRAQPHGLVLPEQLSALSSSSADEHYKEERRLMYVAATRAKERLYFSFSKRHFTATPRKASRFLSELFDSLPEAEEVTDDIDSLQLQIANPTKQTVNLPSNMLVNGRLILSVSQITTYLNCPLDFYYRFVLGVPEPESHNASYGTAIHGVIQAYNQAKLDDKPITLKDLEKILNENWHSEGYLSKAHANSAFRQAQQTLKNFYDIHETDIIPSRVEWPFSCIINGTNLTIKGRLDAVFETLNFTEIRDYKTSSSVTTPEKAKSRATSSLQLTLYALVWQQLNNELPDKLVLEFVDTQQVGEVKKTQKSIDTMYEKLQKMVTEIKNANFTAGKDHSYCLHPPLD